MKKVMMIITAIVVSLSAYTIKLANIGEVVIPDSICNIELANNITKIYNEYNYKKLMGSYVKQVGGAKFDDRGSQIIAIYNFINSTNFNVRLFIDKINGEILGVKEFAAIYISQSNVIVINSVYLNNHTRTRLFYILAHELAHKVQFEEGMFIDAEESFLPLANRLVNEIYADLLSILCVGNISSVTVRDVIKYSQTAKGLARYAGKDSTTAEIILQAIITDRNIKLTI
jgi:hypothetical protein